MIKTCKECGNQFTTNRGARDYCSRGCSNTVIARNRENQKLSGKPTTVWSCGGGVESTAMAVLICAGKLPKPDYAVMTDCGYEKRSTWEYVNTVIGPRLKEAGIELHIIQTLDYTDNRLVDKGDYVLIPAYRNEGGKVVKLRTACNHLWKVRPVRKWLRERGVSFCENWLGISAKEAHRMRKPSHKWFTHRYPLVEMGIDRGQCLWLIGANGWPMPPKTSCVMCPQQDDASWIMMRDNHPDDFARAVEIERELQNIDENVYLHRSLRPLEQVFG